MFKIMLNIHFLKCKADFRKYCFQFQSILPEIKLTSKVIFFPLREKAAQCKSS